MFNKDAITKHPTLKRRRTKGVNTCVPTDEFTSNKKLDLRSIREKKKKC